MRKFLIPLLAALALPTAVNAGNLGVADLMLSGLDVREEEKSKNLFEINVGRDTRSGTAEFSNGRFIIKTDEKSLIKMKREGNIPKDIELDESGKFNKPIVTAITNAPVFYIAEEYHQDFYKKQSMRYQMYAQASGRKGYLENTWGED